MKTHYTFAIGLLYVLWRHCRTTDTLAIYYILASTGLFALSTLTQVTRFLYRNFPEWWRDRQWKREVGRYSQAYIETMANVARVQVPIRRARAWKIKPGQYLQVCFPGLHYWNPFQMHPFMVVWWDADRDGCLVSIDLLIQRRRGMTGDMIERKIEGFHTILIDGPFGTPRDFGEHGHVVMIATGIGISAQLPYLKSLVQGFKSCDIVTRRVALFWETDSEGKSTSAAVS